MFAETMFDGLSNCDNTSVFNLKQSQRRLSVYLYLHVEIRDMRDKLVMREFIQTTSLSERRVFSRQRARLYLALAHTIRARL